MINDQRRTVAAITVILAGIGLAAVSLFLIFGRRGVISPVPEDSGITIIFISPTPGAGIGGGVEPGSRIPSGETR